MIYSHVQLLDQTSDRALLVMCSKVGEAIEEALQRMGCPYPLQAHQIQGLDYPAVLLVVQWLVKRVLQNREESGDQVSARCFEAIIAAITMCSTILQVVWNNISDKRIF